MRHGTATVASVTNAGPVRWRLPALIGIAAGLLISLCAAALTGAQQVERSGDNGITAVTQPGEVTARLSSSRVITVVLPNLDPQRTTLGAQDFSLQSDTDPAYRNAQPAVRLGVDRQVTGFVDDRTAITETRVHLLLPHALYDGLPYRLHAPAAGVKNLPVTWQSGQASDSIQLNQVGYLPASRKLAYVGNWLGNAGPMPVDATDFRVIDIDSGDTVLQGKLHLRAASDPWSGNDVYTADFSTLQTTGNYRVLVPGLGQSDSFRIATDVYDAVYRTTARYFYHHRNSTAVRAPWAASGYERPGGIPELLDAVFHESVASSPLGTSEPANSYRRVSGGWFDAGDYGQYIPNAAPVWYVIGAALDIAPQRFRDGDLNIPESGNGLPDLLDELEWGMDWALQMQDPADGGVYFRVASASWDSSLPHEIKKARLISEKTTHATAAFAAMAAIHARLLEKYRPVRAATVLAAARHAWQFLQTHPQWPPEGKRYHNPDGIHAGEYPDNSAQDNILWAAAELYRTTGEAGFHDAFMSHVGQVNIDPTGVVSFKDQGMAAHWAYLMAPWPNKDETLVKRARDIFLAAADWRIRKMQEHPYHAPVHQYRGYLGWGSFGHSSRATLTLFQAWHLSDKLDYLEWAWMTPHPQLGANPQGISYITGIGARSPLYPLSKLSQYDNLNTPLPGIPVNGPHAHLPALWASTRAVNAAYFPAAITPASAAGADTGDDGYPVLRRYTDSDYLPPMSEPTIAEAARTAIAYGLLRNPNTPPRYNKLKVGRALSEKTEIDNKENIKGL